jgi:hypothetical protein
MAENKIKINHNCENIMSDFEAQGCTSVICAIDSIN